MSTEKYSNFGQSTLNGSITDSATTLTVTAAGTFPASPQFRLLIGSELLLVTGVAGSVFTVTRGIESTTPVAHSDLATVTELFTKGSLDQILADNKPVATEALCSADTAFVSGSWTDVTGCSLTLLAGTYLILANIQFRNNGGATSTGACKIYYGTTNLIAGEYSLGGGFNAVFTMQKAVVLATSQTVKIAGRNQGATVFQAKQYGDYDMAVESIPGTNLVAIKLS